MGGGISLPEDFSQSFKHALKVIDSADSLRVVSHYDADGLSAGAIMARALFRARKPFHMTITKGLDGESMDRLAKEENQAVLFMDMGSGQIEGLETLGAKVAALDHHKPLRKSRKVVQVNPHFHGIDGMSDACTATLSLLAAVTMDPCNWDLAPIAIAGVIGDRQHMGGMKGLNQQVLDHAAEDKSVTVQRGLNLKGKTVADAITDSVDPFFVGLSGRRENVVAFLESMNINPEMSVGSMEDVYRRKLTSMLSLRLMGQGCRPETVEELVAEVHWIPSMGLTAAHLADLMNACGRMGREGVGIALCMGDKEALDEAAELCREYNARLMQRLSEIEADGAAEMDHLQHIEVAEASLGGAVCGLAMQYILDQSRPTLALSQVGTKLKVSGRGTKYLVSKGLDLASALKKAAEKVGGNGGGHSVAAGATVGADGKDEFLAAVDSLVGIQLK